MHIAYHPSYNHPVPAHHRFPMKKYDDVYLSIINSPLKKSCTFLTPNLCEWETIQLVHEKDYIKHLMDKTLDKSSIRRIGFELDERIIERERYIMDGTLQVSLMALEHHPVGFNIAGGTHHAFSNRGEGFCIFNDFAISAAYILKHKLCENILIIDCDVHQGNGTAEIFQNNPHVFTFSMHGKNNFPFEKENSDLDIELEDGIHDEEYLHYLHQSLDFIDRIFHPDIIFYQCGVDILHTDKMGKLNISTNGCAMRDEIVFQYAHSKGLPIVCALGGGYSSKLEDIVSQHIQTFLIADKLYSSSKKHP